MCRLCFLVPGNGRDRFSDVVRQFVGLVVTPQERLYENKPFLTVARWMWPVGSIATLAGWYVTETGRQPWLVEGLVRTMEVASPLPAEKVLWSLSVFVVLYGTLLVAYLYFMRKLLRQGAPCSRRWNRN